MSKIIIQGTLALCSLGVLYAGLSSLTHVQHASLSTGEEAPELASNIHSRRHLKPIPNNLESNININKSEDKVFSINLAFNGSTNASLPVVINTWYFTNATQAAYAVVQWGGTALDAVEAGCSECELERCDGTVGYGGSPDEAGETTLDAMIMDGTTHSVGAVGALRGIKSAIAVARHVLEYTQHTLLVGSQATQFALQMGFQLQNLTTQESVDLHEFWLRKDCQPNFWKNVFPPPDKSCGPYEPLPHSEASRNMAGVHRGGRRGVSSVRDHDTIGMVVVDMYGHIACGTSSNGAKHKLPGRVGDAPVPGSGCYVDSEVGGAAATGDGDIMMRFSPSLVTVLGIKSGLTASEAAAEALRQVALFYPEFSGGIVAVTMTGEVGAACHGFSEFYLSVSNPEDEVEVLEVQCTYP